MNTDELLKSILCGLDEIRNTQLALSEKIDKITETRDDLLLNCNQAAQILNVSRSTFYRMKKRGYIKEVTRNGKVGFLRSQVLEIL